MSDHPTGGYQGPHRPGSAQRPGAGSGPQGGYAGPRAARPASRPEHTEPARAPEPAPQPDQFSAPTTPPPAAPTPHTAAGSGPILATHPAGMVSRGLIAAMALIAAVLAFAAPWVTVDGTVSITFSRTGRLAGHQIGSGGAGWAVFFTIVMVAIAAAALVLATDVEKFAGVRLGGGAITVVLVLASWLGRSVWLGSGDSGPVDGQTRSVISPNTGHSYPMTCRSVSSTDIVLCCHDGATAEVYFYY